MSFWLDDEEGTDSLPLLEDEEGEPDGTLAALVALQRIVIQQGEPLQKMVRGVASWLSSGVWQLREMLISWGQGSMKLPGIWAGRIDVNNIRYIGSGRTGSVCTAPVQAHPQFHVAIKSAPRSLESENEASMLDRMRWSGNVVACFGVQTYPEMTYLLMDAAETDLEQLLQKRFAETGEYSLPLNQSMPVLIDLLRGIRDLEAESIVHGDLTEENVLIKEGRALIADLGTARLVDPSEVLVGQRQAAWDAALGPLVRQPPETIAGTPTGPSNNVWAVGLIFGNMCFGYTPTELLLLKEPDAWEAYADTKDREAFAAIVRREFAVHLIPDFVRLEPEAQRLLGGLLEKDVDLRWSAEEALREAMSVSLRLGVPVEPPRQPARPPPGDWESDWQ